MNLLEKHAAEINALCENHKVKQLYAFGSILNNEFNAESDIDLLVNFENIKLELYANNYFNFKFSLEDLFSREVDLVEEGTIKNPFFKKTVLENRRLLYGN
jgi:predicted nucleotidyltransferase